MFLNNVFSTTTQECPAKTDLDPYCVFCQNIEALPEICADINSIYLECLQKSIQFCSDTANIRSRFIEIFRDKFSATEYPWKSKVDIITY